MSRGLREQRHMKEVANPKESGIRRPKLYNPYAGEGTWHKVQLHTHTTASDGRLTPEELLEAYRAAGYTFVAITDHDRVTLCTRYDGAEFLSIPGEENTVSGLFWPLGRHLLRLFTTRHLAAGTAQAKIDQSREEGALTALCHPGWVGNLGMGQWRPARIRRLRGFNFVEVFNHFSNPTVDLSRWYEALRDRGPEEPVWGIAVDDTHRREDIDRGWVVVKVPEVSRQALYQALMKGAFYASTGAKAEFGVQEGQIVVRTPEEARIRFFSQTNRLLAESQGREAAYLPAGDEGFIRVEVLTPAGTAWSQPFWLALSRNH